MVAVALILFPVQHFQQRRAGVTPIVAAHFIHLIQKQDGIAAAGLGQSRHNPARHSADIGLPMTPDIRLIPDTAQRNSGHFPVQTSRNRISNGCFTYTGRANQAKNLWRHFRRHLTNCDGLQNPLLHLLKAIVIPIQDLFRPGHIQPFLGILIPRQFQNRIQIIAQNSSLRRTKGLLFQFHYILQQFLFAVGIQFQTLNLLF